MSYSKLSRSKTNKLHQSVTQTDKQTLELYNSLLENNTHHITISQLNSTFVHSQYVIRLPPCVHSLTIGHSLTCICNTYNKIIVPHTVSHVRIEAGCPVPFIFHNRITHLKINVYYQHNLNLTNRLKYLVIELNTQLYEKKLMLYNGLTHLIIRNQSEFELNLPKTLCALVIKELRLRTKQFFIPKSMRYISLNFSYSSCVEHILLPSKVKRMSMYNNCCKKIEYNIPKYLTHLYVSTFYNDKITLPDSLVYVCLCGCNEIVYDNIPNSVLNYEFSMGLGAENTNCCKNVPNSVKYIVVVSYSRRNIMLPKHIVGTSVGLENIFHRYNNSKPCEILYGDETNYECTGKQTINNIFIDCIEVWRG